MRSIYFKIFKRNIIAYLRTFTYNTCMYTSPVRGPANVPSEQTPSVLSSEMKLAKLSNNSVAVLK